ncbi:hypothetical protein KY361_00350 [Candidatus Woesearchaeota archaeon]|nr:hypothetical protein [Candidatus Woesearchaeota archaeon]
MKKKVNKHKKVVEHSKGIKKLSKNIAKKHPKKHLKKRSHKHHSIYRLRKITKDIRRRQPKKVQRKRITTPKKVIEKPEKDYDKGPETPVYRHEYVKEFIERSTNAYYGGLFSKTYDLVREKPKIFYKTLGLDLLLLLILVLIFRGSMRFFPKGIVLFDVFGSLYVFATAIFFFLFGILIYSLEKCKVLLIVGSMLEGIKLNLERFDKFFVLNCITMGVWFLIFFIMYAIAYIVEPLMKGVIWIVFALISVFIYSFINISHWLFAHEPKFRKTVKRALIILTDGFEKYVGISSLMFSVAIVYSLIAFGIGWILKLAEGNIEIHKKIAVVIGIIILYATLAYNRLCFYFVVKKLKNEIKD